MGLCRFFKGSVHHKLLLLWFLLIRIVSVYLPTFRSISGGKWSFVCVFITCRTQTAIETVPSDVCWSFTELKLNSIYLHKSYSSHLSHYQLICRLFSFNFSLKYQVNVWKNGRREIFTLWDSSFKSLVTKKRRKSSHLRSWNHQYVTINQVSRPMVSNLSID